jgi:hypothetical protein
MPNFLWRSRRRFTSFATASRLNRPNFCSVAGQFCTLVLQAICWWPIFRSAPIVVVGSGGSDTQCGLRLSILTRPSSRYHNGESYHWIVLAHVLNSWIEAKKPKTCPDSSETAEVQQACCWSLFWLFVLWRNDDPHAGLAGEQSRAGTRIFRF